ncbi:MAG: hypothetical protein ABJD07_12855, partial [Gemmatimonadaceae bacterium]
SGVLRRPVAAVRVPPRVIWLAALGTTIAWLAYGVAFALFSRALLTEPHRALPGVLLPYIAVYACAYVIGYLFLPAPAGLGVREGVLVAGMTALGLATEPEAIVIAFASRLWLTMLEVVPGLLLLAYTGLRRGPRHDTPNG